ALTLRKGLIVAKAGLDIVVRPGVGAPRPTLAPPQFLALLPDHAYDIVLGRLAAERHRAVDSGVDFRRAVVEKVAAETGRHFDDDLRVPASHPFLGLVRGGNRRLDREIARAVEALKQPAALGRIVLVERRGRQVLDVERDSIAEGEHENDRAEKREGEPDRIAQELDRLTPCVSPEAA